MGQSAGKVNRTHTHSLKVECTACELRPRRNVTFDSGIEKGVVIPVYIPNHVVLSKLVFLYVRLPT